MFHDRRHAGQKLPAYPRSIQPKRRCGTVFAIHTSGLHQPFITLKCLVHHGLTPTRGLILGHEARLLTTIIFLIREPEAVGAQSPARMFSLWSRACLRPASVNEIHVYR